MAVVTNFPIATAAINWIDPQGNLNIRVYSCDGYNVVERYIGPQTSTWQTGAFSAPGSDVSATCWQDSSGVHIRVYCTFEDKTTEWCSDPGTNWTQGSYTQP